MIFVFEIEGESKAWGCYFSCETEEEFIEFLEDTGLDPEYTGKLIEIFGEDSGVH